ncbi:hypothetical protein, partial [Streptomyces sp. NRRL WC-3719]|uniref:hypothetical protein n=1 Tax=Streptomyces sp. NRRL WC-3719 TaxID=1463932 RepID=UPI003B6395DE
CHDARANDVNCGWEPISHTTPAPTEPTNATASANRTGSRIPRAQCPGSTADPAVCHPPVTDEANATEGADNTAPDTASANGATAPSIKAEWKAWLTTN